MWFLPASGTLPSRTAGRAPPARWLPRPACLPVVAGFCLGVDLRVSAIASVSMRQRCSRDSREPPSAALDPQVAVAYQLVDPGAHDAGVDADLAPGEPGGAQLVGDLPEADAVAGSAQR